MQLPLATDPHTRAHHAREIPFARPHKVSLERRRPSVAYAQYITVIRPDPVEFLVEAIWKHAQLGEYRGEDLPCDGRADHIRSI